MKPNNECYMGCCFNSGEIEGTDLEYCLADIDGYTYETAQAPDEEGYMGGVPTDCPIYQGEVAEPWKVIPLEVCNGK